MIKIRLVGTPEKPVSDKVRKQLNELDNKCLECLYPKDGAYWWLATMDGEPVGFCGLKPLSGYNKGMAFLCRAGVLPKANGYKLQRRFIKIRIKKAIQIGIKEIVTYTNRYNYKCITNMIKCGMRFYNPQVPYGDSQSVYFNMKID